MEISKKPLINNKFLKSFLYLHTFKHHNIYHIFKGSFFLVTLINPDNPHKTAIQHIAERFYLKYHKFQKLLIQLRVYIKSAKVSAS